LIFLLILWIFLYTTGYLKNQKPNPTAIKNVANCLIRFQKMAFLRYPLNKSKKYIRDISIAKPE